MDSGAIDWEEKVNSNKLNLANEKLTTLKGISKCKNLTWLNISNNLLESLQWVKKLKKLNVLTASNNNISTCKHLSDLSELKALILNNNKIACVQGIKGLKNLNTLVLSHNEIEDIEVTDLVSLSKLSLSHNKLTKVPGLKSHANLKELRLNDNRIEDISDTLQSCKQLKLVDLGNNQISKFEFLNVLKKLEIQNLNLKGNPICSDKDYQKSVINELHTLKILDGRRITGTVSNETKVAEVRDKALKKEKIREKEEKDVCSAEETQQSTEKTVSKHKELPTKNHIGSKEKSVRTGGFVSKFSLETKNVQEVKNNKKRKKSKQFETVKKSKIKFDDLTEGKDSENNVGCSEKLYLCGIDREDKTKHDKRTDVKGISKLRQSKNGGDDRENKAKDDKENDVRTDVKAIPKLRQSKNGGGEADERKSKSRIKRKRKFESHADSKTNPGKSVSSSSRHLCSKADKISKTTESVTKEAGIITEQGSNVSIEKTGRNDKRIKKPKRKSVEKANEGAKKLKHNVKEVAPHKKQMTNISSDKKHQSSKSSNTIDSRSGVVSVEQVVKGSKNKSKRNLNVMDKSYEFGTGKSFAW